MADALPTRMHHRFVGVGFVVAVVAACSGGTTGVGVQPSSDGGLVDGGGGGDSGRDAAARTGSCGGDLTGGARGATVDFELSATGSFCTGSPGTCDPTWLTILDGKGATLAHASSCATSCGDCQPVGCPANCPQPSTLPADGVRETWDGRIFTANTCKNGGDGELSCFDLNCAPAGHYIARMCAFRVEGDGGVGPNACSGLSSSQKPTCTDVPFDWPTSATVRGTLAP